MVLCRSAGSTLRCLTRYLILAPVLAVGSAGAAAAPEAPRPAGLDPLFAAWNKGTPGCVVGIDRAGQPPEIRAWGMADLEHGVPNTADTIFEAGSVSKQFTAAAIALLARDGKLSLDDEARKYLPELPDYGTPLTIRQMLNHTAGLRDWGEVADIAGWPRTTRVTSQAFALKIASRQRALNFTPGTRWSYSNSGYTLAAIIVQRVSGLSFAEFTRQRLFAPLGMDHTSWRDDFTRIVPGRAQAYQYKDGAWHQLMPFEDVVGHGGLLTTIGDLLKWNRNMAQPVVADAAFWAAAAQPGRFTDGVTHNYGLGLFAGTYRGTPIISHTGATAGYRAELRRLPQRQLSVALLCNDAGVKAGPLADSVTDVVWGGETAAFSADRRAPAADDGATLAALAGWYRNDDSGAPLALQVATAPGTGLKLAGGAALTPAQGGAAGAAGTQRLRVGATRYDFASGNRLTVTDQFGRATAWHRVPAVAPGAAQLAALSGTWASAEADSRFTLAMEQGGLVLRQQPDRVLPLKPLIADTFRAGPVTLVFRRDAAGAVNAVSVQSERVWDLRFVRQPAL